MLKHNWTKETMGDCAKVYLDLMIESKYNNNKEKIYKLIEKYFQIKSSINSK